MKPPWCNKCNRPVESFTIETPLVAIPYPGEPTLHQDYTGEIILTIECHGEKWRASNLWGVIR